MLKEETQGFLRKVHPLDLLPEEDLEELVGEVALEYFPRGDRILTQGGAPAEHLYLVKKGGVRVTVASEPGDEIVLDDRSEEEYFGLISVVSGEAPRATIVALEDTICFLVPRDRLLAVLGRHPAVQEKLLKSYLIEFIDRTYRQTRRKYADSSFGRQALVATRVGEVPRREPVTAAAATPIREAAGVMAEHRISSLIVLGAGGEPAGIVTDRDLREKVVATGRPLEHPLGEIMSAPLLTVDAGETCLAALMEMMRHGIHHLAVLADDGRLKGVVTHHDFMVLQGASPAVLVKEMAKTRSLGELTDTVARLRQTVLTLLREGVKPHDAVAAVTELAERFVNRVVDLWERERGTAPVPWSLFLLGDGGRRELALDCRLELAVAYEEADDAAARERTGPYFESLVELFDRTLRTCGEAVGGRLPAERVRSFAAWRAAFEEGEEPPPAELFDLRPIRGDQRAVEALRRGLLQRAAADPRAIAALVAETVANRPPLGFFRRFVIAKSGEHRHELDLYGKGMRPLVEVVRILALEKGVEARSTKGRLRELDGGPGLPQGEEIEQAFDYVVALLLHHQLARIDAGEEPDGFVDPESLAPLEKKALKEAFQLTAGLYERLERAYG